MEKNKNMEIKKSLDKLSRACYIINTFKVL